LGTELWVKIVAIVGAAAWLSPVLYSIILHFFKKPKIRFYDKGNIIFTNFTGAISAGLRCSIDAENRNALVTGMKLLVKHESKNEIILHWNTVREVTQHISNPTGQPIEFYKEIQPGILKITTDEAKDLMVFFSDMAYERKYEILIRELIDQILYRLKNKSQNDAEEIKNILTELKKESIYKDILYLWNDSLYLKSGMYELELRIKEKNKITDYKYKYKFQIQPGEIEILREYLKVFDEIIEYTILNRFNLGPSMVIPPKSINLEIRPL